MRIQDRREKSVRGGVVAFSAVSGVGGTPGPVSFVPRPLRQNSCSRCSASAPALSQPQEPVQGVGIQRHEQCAVGATAGCGLVRVCVCVADRLMVLRS